MRKKSISIDELAVMVQKGFNETAKKSEIDFMSMQINKRFDKIEKLILADHKNRIEKLEEEVKELKNLFAM